MNLTAAATIAENLQATVAGRKLTAHIEVLGTIYTARPGTSVLQADRVPEPNLYIVFEGGKFGAASIALSVSSPERIAAHWAGYCEAQVAWEDKLPEIEESVPALPYMSQPLSQREREYLPRVLWIKAGGSRAVGMFAGDNLLHREANKLKRSGFCYMKGTPDKRRIFLTPKGEALIMRASLKEQP